MIIVIKKMKIDRGEVMKLSTATNGLTAQIKEISGDVKVERFLFSLGCSEGEEITLISKLGNNYIVNIKDSRYAFDKKIAESIQLCS